MSPAPLLADVHHAREFVYRHALRTPLIRYNGPAPPGSEIWLKLENLQPIGSFKIRGAASAIERLTPAELQRGVWTASMGNMAQGVAACARKLGIPARVVVPDVAAQNKIRAIERLGGTVLTVTFDEWWRTFRERSHPAMQGAFIHAFDDPFVMQGNGTIALEILEDLPAVENVIVPWGGGGLSCGIASVLRQTSPRTRIWAAEAASAAPLAQSLAAGSPQQVDYLPSFVDGIGAKSVFPAMFERAQALLDGSLVAQVPQIAAAVRHLAERNRIVAEGAGACPLACALDNSQLRGPTVCIVSGGNIDSTVLSELLKPS